MARSGEKLSGMNTERFWRIYRNWNALATVAFAGANVLYPGSTLIQLGLGLNIGQTIFGEVMLQRAKHKTSPSFI